MKKTIEKLINANGEIYYKTQTDSGDFIYSFSEDFLDYWTDAE